MALSDTATLVIGAGNFFTAPVNTALPADLSGSPRRGPRWVTPPLEDIFATESEGGEATVLGTLPGQDPPHQVQPRTERSSPSPSSSSTPLA